MRSAALSDRRCERDRVETTWRPVPRLRCSLTRSIYLVGNIKPLVLLSPDASLFRIQPPSCSASMFPRKRVSYFPSLIFFLSCPFHDFCLFFFLSLIHARVGVRGEFSTSPPQAPRFRPLPHPCFHGHAQCCWVEAPPHFQMYTVLGSSVGDCPPFFVLGPSQGCKWSPKPLGLQYLAMVEGRCARRNQKKSLSKICGRDDEAFRQVGVLLKSSRRQPPHTRDAKHSPGCAILCE